MVTKTVEYVDYNGVEKKEKFYFELNEAELTEMQYSEAGGLKERLERIIAAKDMPAIIKYFKEILLLSYGEKSDDGRHFIKVRNGHRLSEEFEQHKAFSKLYLELANDEQAAAEFIKNVIPQTLQTQ